jgi:hypothetical protein
MHKNVMPLSQILMAMTQGSNEILSQHTTREGSLRTLWVALGNGQQTKTEECFLSGQC